MSTGIDKAVKAMNHAKFIADNYSIDTSTKVGALILSPSWDPLSWGYNGFPRGVNDDVAERYERPLKYAWTEHAERNAIFNAARNGHKLLGARMFVTSLCPCDNCTRASIQSGISEIWLESWAFDPANDRAKVWGETWPICKEMLTEAKVRTYVLTPEGKVQEQHSILV